MCLVMDTPILAIVRIIDRSPDIFIICLRSTIARFLTNFEIVRDYTLLMQFVIFSNLLERAKLSHNAINKKKTKRAN